VATLAIGFSGGGSGVWPCSSPTVEMLAISIGFCSSPPRGGFPAGGRPADTPPASTGVPAGNPDGAAGGLGGAALPADGAAAGGGPSDVTLLFLSLKTLSIAAWHCCSVPANLRSMRGQSHSGAGCRQALTSPVSGPLDEKAASPFAGLYAPDMQ
jgi:hypothetical protein